VDLLVISLVFAAWEASKHNDWRAWLAPFLTGMGAIIFPVYVWLGLGHSPLEILTALNKRGGQLAFPGWKCCFSLPSSPSGAGWDNLTCSVRQIRGLQINGLSNMV
jgi:hypothetical protein